MLGFSSDGDSRLLKCMKYRTPSLANTDEDLLFNSISGINIESIHCSQDHIHMANKFRNRSLCPGIVLPMGNRVVSVAHLKILINEVPKDSHGLVMGDVCPEDHQNYKSVEKIMNQPVLDTLKKHIIGSEATITYLKICQEVTSSFIDIDLKPVERVYRIFHGTYFLRAWKSWLQSPGTNI